MSILALINRFINQLAELLDQVSMLFFTPCCAVCEQSLEIGERSICTLCRATAPLTHFWLEADNPMAQKFWGHVPIHRASGFIYFTHGSGWRRLIHNFKYRGAWRSAEQIGCWYGNTLSECGLYDDIDVVIPLPLHPRKRLRRGYNQSEYIARGVASQMGLKVDSHSVRRTRNTASQALKPRSQRATNVAKAFSVAYPERLADRHILLIDDVFTTGSTIIACADAIHRAAPSCRISVAVIAVSQRELGVKE